MFDGIDMVVRSFRSLRLGLWLAVDWSEPPALECDGLETQSPCYSRPVPLDPLTHTYYVWCVSVVGRGVCILYYVRSGGSVSVGPALRALWGRRKKKRPRY